MLCRSEILLRLRLRAYLLLMFGKPSAWCLVPGSVTVFLAIFLELGFPPRGFLSTISLLRRRKALPDDEDATEEASLICDDEPTIAVGLGPGLGLWFGFGFGYFLPPKRFPSTWWSGSRAVPSEVPLPKSQCQSQLQLPLICQNLMSPRAVFKCTAKVACRPRDPLQRRREALLLSTRNWFLGHCHCQSSQRSESSESSERRRRSRPDQTRSRLGLWRGNHLEKMQAKVMLFIKLN